jgi:alanine racemase
MVRPGIALYGANPSSSDSQTSAKLQPVMRLSSTVINIQHIDAGEAVGYNERWRAEKPSTIATIAIGYADGYPRHAPNGTPVFIKGKTYPLVGTVSMDLITVDITDSDIELGDKVELWGENLRVETIAEYAQTISYELLSKVSDRVVRIFT